MSQKRRNVWIVQSPSLGLMYTTVSPTKEAAITAAILFYKGHYEWVKLRRMGYKIAKFAEVTP